MICVQKRGNRWWVWMDFASDDENKPGETDAKFYREDDALNYALDWAGHDFVEYGVVRLAAV